MKRGLKRKKRALSRRQRAGRRDAPMKRGLKPRAPSPRSVHRLARPKRCPDEEGIETSVLARNRPSIWRPKRCPDEEGIERGSREGGARRPQVGRRDAPMKRGLKQLNEPLAPYSLPPEE